MTEDIVGIARAAYDCYVTKDRAAIEALISDDFTSAAPWTIGSTVRRISCGAGPTAHRLRRSTSSTSCAMGNGCS